MKTTTYKVQWCETKLFLLSIAVVAACGGSRQVGSTTDNTGTEIVPKTTKAPIVAGRLHFALEFAATSNVPKTTVVSLVETDETGGNERYKIDTFEGECTDISANSRAVDAKVFLAFRCLPTVSQQRAAVVHVLKRQGRLVLLRAWLDDPTQSAPNFDDFNQIHQLPPYRQGVPLTTDFD